MKHTQLLKVLFLGGIIGFVGCSVLVIARDDTRRKK